MSNDNIAACLADPPLVWQVVEHEDDSAYRQELASQSKVSLLTRLFGKPRPEPVARQLRFAPPELAEVDLDKSWDGLRACLARLAPDAPGFFEGTGQVGAIDVGYGPALYHRAETMRQIHAAFTSVSGDALVAAYRAIDPAELYPRGLWHRDDDEVEAYLVDNFLALREFTGQVNAHGLGVIIRMT